MPNHVCNQISTDGDFAELRAALLSMDGGNAEVPGDVVVDFEKILPIPKELRDISTNSNGEIGLYILTKKRSNPYMLGSLYQERYDIASAETKKEMLELGQRYKDNEEKYGHATWYSWSIDNWGTKWNAYDTYIEGDMIQFSTAWSGVPKLMVILSVRLQGHALTYEYADEDTGCNVGSMIIKGGEVIHNEELPNSSRAAYEHAFRLNGNSEMYRLVNGEYEWYDEEEALHEQSVES